MYEPVYPRNEPAFIRNFCGNTENPDDIKQTEEKRVAFYKAMVSLIGAYADVANEMNKPGYNEDKAKETKKEVQFYSDLRGTIKQASGDALDYKRFEPGMRQLMNMYLDAGPRRKEIHTGNIFRGRAIIKWTTGTSLKQLSAGDTDKYMPK